MGRGLALSASYGGAPYDAGLALGGGYGAALSVPVGPLPAAIQSTRTYEVRPISLPQEPAVPQIIEIEPSEQPVQIIFRSISSPVHVQQIHTPGAPGQVESTNSEDEPHRVTHEVMRPVIQEIREVIQPYRRVVQEVRPVLEEVHTVVAKGEPRPRTVLAPIATKAYAQPVIESAPLLDRSYGGYKKAKAAAAKAA